MSAESDAALHLVTVLSDTSMLKPKLDEFIRRKTEADAAEKRLADTEREHQNARNEIDNYVARRKSELNEAQIAHDKSAKEAADRIALQQIQFDNLQQKEKELQDRELVVSDREININSRESDLMNLQQELGVRNAEVVHGEEELKARHKRLQQALE